MLDVIGKIIEWIPVQKERLITVLFATIIGSAIGGWFYVGALQTHIQNGEKEVLRLEREVEKLNKIVTTEREYKKEYIERYEKFVGEKINEYLKQLEKAKAQESIIVRKWASSETDIENDIFVPRPGYNVTILPNSPVTFAWGKNKGSSIVFKNDNGEKIFEKAIQGESSIQLKPKEIGLKPLEKYTWDIIGIRLYGVHRLILLEDKSVQQVLSDLNYIEALKIDTYEKKVKKSGYLQLMSDTYPEKIDLYWLSYEILKGLDNNNMVTKLKEKYLNHLDKTYVSK